jgi:hypothetical protein
LLAADLRVVATRPKLAPRSKCVRYAPAGRGRLDAVLDLERVAELAEHAEVASRELEGLPVPQVAAERAGRVVQVLDRAEPERVLDRLLVRGGAVREDGVDVRDDRLHVRGAVLRHLPPDRLEVLPEVLDGLDHAAAAVAGPKAADLRHRPAGERPAVGPAHEDPGSGGRVQIAAARKGQLDVLRKVVEVGNG